MTSGVCASGKALVGQSTNWAKLYKKTALIRYSGGGAVCAGKFSPPESNQPQTTNPTAEGPFHPRFAHWRVRVLRSAIKPFHTRRVPPPGAWAWSQCRIPGDDCARGS